MCKIGLKYFSPLLISLRLYILLLFILLYLSLYPCLLHPSTHTLFPYTLLSVENNLIPRRRGWGRGREEGLWMKRRD
jgi:hypothetical protein